MQIHVHINIVFTNMKSSNTGGLKLLDLVLEFYRSQVLCLFIHFKWPQKLYRNYLAQDVLKRSDANLTCLIDQCSTA